MYIFHCVKDQKDLNSKSKMAHFIMIQDMFSNKRDVNGYMYRWLITP